MRDPLALSFQGDPSDRPLRLRYGYEKQTVVCIFLCLQHAHSKALDGGKHDLTHLQCA